MAKRWARRGMAMGLVICLLLSFGVPVSADKAHTHTGTLLRESFILDGAENITINEDGSWTVAGPFTLACPVSYDYRIADIYV